MSEIIRPARRADAAAINRIYNYYIQNTSVSFELEAWDDAKRAAWFAQFPGDKNRYHALVADNDGIITGFAYNAKMHPRAGYQTACEVTIYTDAECPQSARTPDTAVALYTELFAHINETDLHRAYAVIALPNPKSIAFHEKFGFTAIGTLHEVGRKFGKFMDVTWMEKRLK